MASKMAAEYADRGYVFCEGLLSGEIVYDDTDLPALTPLEADCLVAAGR
jgi:hypothetical protein